MLKKHRKEILIGLITGVLNGLFGAGGGCVVVPAAEKLLGMDERKSHATAIAVILMMSAVSSVIYIRKGFFNLKIWMLVSAGGVVGGYVGAKLLGGIPKRFLKLVFGGIILLTAMKMIF